MEMRAFEFEWALAYLFVGSGMCLLGGVFVFDELVAQVQRGTFNLHWLRNYQYIIFHSRRIIPPLAIFIIDNTSLCLLYSASFACVLDYSI